MIKKPFGIVPGGFCFYMYFVKNYKKNFIVLIFYIKFIPTFATNQYHF